MYLLTLGYIYHPQGFSVKLISKVSQNSLLPPQSSFFKTQIFSAQPIKNSYVPTKMFDQNYPTSSFSSSGFQFFPTLPYKNHFMAQVCLACDHFFNSGLLRL